MLQKIIFYRHFYRNVSFKFEADCQKNSEHFEKQILKHAFVKVKKGLNKGCLTLDGHIFCEHVKCCKKVPTKCSDKPFQHNVRTSEQVV